MEQQSRRILLTALALAVISDVLLCNAAPGANVFLVTGVILLAILFLKRSQTLPFPVPWAAVLCLLAAAGFALRDSPTLIALAGLGLTASALLGIRQARIRQVATGGVLQTLAALVQTARDVLVESVLPLRQKQTWAMLTGGEGRAQTAVATARGLLLTVPVVLVFGALLSSADPIFAHFIAAAFQWDVSNVVSHLLWVAVGTAVTGGVLRLLTATSTLVATTVPETQSAPRPFSIGRIETMFILGALDGLFGAFVLVQMRYFFGGQSAVQSTVGMTYAMYARHGFFELVWVAGLCLPLLLTLHTGQRPEDQRSYRALAGIILVLLFVIMASALGRMNLYRSEYGLTELRLYTTAFMGWLAVVFVWFAATVLRGRREWFALGAAGFAAAGVLTLFLFNPDATIVRANARLSQSGRTFDACYATSLSADAVPELMDTLSSLPVPAQQITAARLLSRWGTSSAADWREWCWGRWAAQHAVQIEKARLELLSAAAPVRACASRDDGE